MFPIASLALVFDLLVRDRASQAFNDVGNAANQAGQQTSRFGETTKKAMGLAAGAIAAAGIGTLLKDSIGLAADAEQSIGGAQAVFKDYADTVVDASKAADRALGLSANSYRELATVIGSQLKNAGVPMDELAEKTDGLVEMGADLAAMFGGTTQEAVQALSSALKGEMDPIEAYGISLSAAALEAEAVALGLDVMGGSLTTSQRAMAVMSLVTKQGADAVGAFARESDTAAGRAARAAASWENLKVAVGDELLPVWSSLVGVLGEDVVPALGSVIDVVGGAVDILGEIPGPVWAGVAAATALMLINGPLALSIGRATLALNAWYVRALTAASGTGVLAGAMAGLRTAAAGTLAMLGGPLGIAIIGAVTGLSLLASGNNDAAEAEAEHEASVKDLADALRESNGEITDNIRLTRIKEAQDKGLIDAAERAGVSTRDIALALDGENDALERVTGAIRTYAGEQIAVVASGYNTEKVLNAEGVAALEAAEGFEGMGGEVDIARRLLEEQNAVLGETGDAMDATTVQTQEATKALEEWLKRLQQIGEGFVQPLSVYRDLLSQKSEAERESAEATAAATDSATDSWEDYVGDVQVSLGELATALQTQLDNQANWRTNLGLIAQWAGADVAKYLAEMGAEGVDIVAQMADGTTAGAQDMRAQILREIEMGGAEWAASMDNYMKIMAVIGRDGAKATRSAMAKELGIGVGEIQRIADQYGLSLATGINPILRSLGKPVVNYNQQAGRGYSGVLEYSADGNLYENHTAQIAPGGAWRVWAEPETGGEAYIPLSPAKRGRSLDIWREVGDRLGVQFQEFAFGGINDVPRPPSTAPYRPPISTAADATMQKGFDEVRAWLETNAGGVAGSGAVGGKWTSLWELVKAAIPAARINSTYRPGDPGYHGRNKAIDFGFGSGPGGAGSAGLASINRLLHDQVGRNLAELIYDGIGDDRPDLKNGRPLTYSAATRAAHRNHVHAAVYDNGGLLPPGLSVNYNGTGQYETVRTAEQEAALRGPLDLSDASLEKLGAIVARNINGRVAAYDSATFRHHASRPR